jgi:hypothetical protein
MGPYTARDILRYITGPASLESKLPPARFFARVLYCTVHCRAVLDPDQSECSPAEKVTAGLNVLLDGTPTEIFGADDPHRVRLDRFMHFVDHRVHDHIHNEIQTLLPLDAVRFRLALVVTHCRTLCEWAPRLPLLRSVGVGQHKSITLSNDLDGLTNVARALPLRFYVGSSRLVAPSDAACALRCYVDRTHVDGITSTPSTLTIPDMAVFNNLVNFHVTDKAIRARLGRALLHSAGIQVYLGTETHTHTITPSGVDPLQYRAMRHSIDAEADVHAAWVNLEVAPVPVHSDAAFTGARLLSHYGIVPIR